MCFHALEKWSSPRRKLNTSGPHTAHMSVPLKTAPGTRSYCSSLGARHSAKGGDGGRQDVLEPAGRKALNHKVGVMEEGVPWVLWEL